MKLPALGLFIIFLLSVVATAAPISYPNDEPAFTVSFPEGKEEAKIVGKYGDLLWWSKEGFGVFITPSKATTHDEMKAAATEAITSRITDTGSKDAKVSEPTEKEGKIYVTATGHLEWEGKTRAYAATDVIFEARGKYFELYSLSIPEESKQREAYIASILGTIKPVKDSDK